VVVVVAVVVVDVVLALHCLQVHPLVVHPFHHRGSREEVARELPPVDTQRPAQRQTMRRRISSSVVCSFAILHQ
jgi:hypothetical protein